MSQMPRRPVDALLLGRIDDYVRGVGSEDEAAAFEEEMFAQSLEGETPELRDYGALIASLRDVGERGTLENFIVKADADKLLARYGDRVAYHEFTGEKPERAVISASAEFFMSKVWMDLEGVERVDIEIEVEGVGVIKTMPDVAFEPDAGAVYGCCEGDLARLTVGLTIISRYWAHDKSGRRLIRETRVESALGA